MAKGLDKGNVLDGMHRDLFVVSFLTGLTSVVGLPWMAGATTRMEAFENSTTNEGYFNCGVGRSNVNSEFTNEARYSNGIFSRFHSFGKDTI